MHVLIGGESPFLVYHRSEGFWGFTVISMIVIHILSGIPYFSGDLWGVDTGGAMDVCFARGGCATRGIVDKKKC